MVGVPGLEPGKTGPESVVLPITPYPKQVSSRCPLEDDAKLHTLPLERPNKSAFFSLSFFCGTRTPFKSHGAESHQNRAERHCPDPKTLLHAEQLTDDVCPRYHSLRTYNMRFSSSIYSRLYTLKPSGVNVLGSGMAISKCNFWRLTSNRLTRM